MSEWYPEPETVQKSLPDVVATLEEVLQSHLNKDELDLIYEALGHDTGAEVAAAMINATMPDVFEDDRALAMYFLGLARSVMNEGTA